MLQNSIQLRYRYITLVDLQSIVMCIIKIKITRDCQICHHMQENKGFYLFEVINNSKLFQQLSYVNQ